MSSVLKLRAGALSLKRSALLTLVVTQMLTGISYAIVYVVAQYAWSCWGISIVGCVLGAFGVVMFGISSIVSSFFVAVQMKDIIGEFKEGSKTYENVYKTN